jgi:hypothetical protein
VRLPSSKDADTIIHARTADPLYVTLASALEEEPNDEDLQTRHCDHHQALDDAKVENATLRAPDCAEVSVFSCPEVLLVAVDGG